MANKKAALTRANKAVMIRCHSGVFFAYLVDRRGSEVDVIGSRHVHYWDSSGLPRKAVTVDDLAILGPGSGSRISGRVSQTLLQVAQVVDCLPEAVKKFESYP